jgi:hypothetical protein
MPCGAEKGKGDFSRPFIPSLPCIIKGKTSTAVPLGSAFRQIKRQLLHVISPLDHVGAVLREQLLDAVPL